MGAVLCVVLGMCWGWSGYSCKPPSEDGKTRHEQDTSENGCVYRVLAPGSIQVGWTAFKTTQKIGVDGKFMTVSWIQPSDISQQTFASVEEILREAQLLIETASLSTGDSIRDRRIYFSFFLQMHKGDSIWVAVDSVMPDHLIARITMNGQDAQIPMQWNLQGDTLRAWGTIDVIRDFSADSALQALNEACKDLHTGPDGVSKTWSTVEIFVELPLKVECPRTSS